MATDLHTYRDSIVQTAQLLLHRGVMQASKHGNISVRVPGTDYVLLTGAALEGMTTENIAVVSLDGMVLDGGLNANIAEVIRMHTCVYGVYPDVGSVVHTHSPHATAFAVAHRPLDVYHEALARLDITEPIPVTRYAPRGSDQAITNIVDVLQEHPKLKGVLLGNHGLLAFGSTPQAASLVVLAMEETAQVALLAQAIGGPQSIAQALAVSAYARKVEFEQKGRVTAAG